MEYTKKGKYFSCGRQNDVICKFLMQALDKKNPAQMRDVETIHSTSQKGDCLKSEYSFDLKNRQEKKLKNLQTKKIPAKAGINLEVIL